MNPRRATRSTEENRSGSRAGSEQVPPRPCSAPLCSRHLDGTHPVTKGA